MTPRVVVLGWDSATFDVIDPLVAAGRLPHLAAIMDRGFRAPLRSTWPPMTDCAWTSAFTGRNPGAHGIFGSWYRAPGAYEARYFSSRDRRAPAVWELAGDVRFLVWNVPMTFPPERINGAMVSGYGAPRKARICEPEDLQRDLSSRFDLEELLDRAPQGALAAFADDLLRGLRHQADALVWAVKRVGADCAIAVWPHVDRAQHFFWRFRGTDHVLAGTVDAVYEAMDAATGAIADAFSDADVLVVSDHGAGSLLGDVNLGAWLVDRGYARFGGGSRARVSDVAWKMPPRVRKLARRFAPQLARRAVGAKLTGQLGPFDWSRTRAFLGFHGDLWLNLTNREAQGVVTPEESNGLLGEISQQLLEMTDPRSDANVFSGVYRWDQIYSGTAQMMAPDLMLDSWSAGYRVAPNRGPGEYVTQPLPLAGVNEAWSADHRPLGIFAAAGPSIARGSNEELSLYQVCPTILALLDEAIPGNLERGPAEAAFRQGFLQRHPIRVEQAAGERFSDDTTYSAAEAAAVAAHLKDLGYIE